MITKHGMGLWSTTPAPKGFERRTSASRRWRRPQTAAADPATKVRPTSSVTRSRTRVTSRSGHRIARAAQRRSAHPHGRRDHRADLLDAWSAANGSGRGSPWPATVSPPRRSALTAPLIDPRWTPHVEGAAAENDALRQMGDLIPIFETPEQVAAMRVVPEIVHERRDSRCRCTTARSRAPRARPAVAGRRAGEFPRRGLLDIHGGGFCMGWPEMHDPANARLAQATRDDRRQPRLPACSGTSRSRPGPTIAAPPRIGSSPTPKREFGTETG